MRQGAQTMDQDVRWFKIGTRAGKTRTETVEYGTRTADLAASRAQAVKSVTLTVNRAS